MPGIIKDVLIPSEVPWAQAGLRSDSLVSMLPLPGILLMFRQLANHKSDHSFISGVVT